MKCVKRRCDVLRLCDSFTSAVVLVCCVMCIFFPFSASGFVGVDISC